MPETDTNVRQHPRSPGFLLEEVADSQPQRTEQQSRLQNAALATLLLALKTLGQKTIIAISKCFTLFTSIMVFWLWMSVPDPNPHQLIGMGMFAVFTLIVNWIVLRRGE